MPFADGVHLELRTKAFAADSPALRWGGPWEHANLRDRRGGKLGTGGAASELRLDFTGEGVALEFWGHPWSGFAHIAVGGHAREVNLFHESGAFLPVYFDGLGAGPHTITVRGTGQSDPRSQGTQVVFHRALAWERVAGAADPARRPGRFEAIHTAPTLLTWPERVALYGTAFTARPRRVLALGVGPGGACGILGAALADQCQGHVTALDPEPTLSLDYWILTGARVELRTELTPADGPFDFVFVDPDWDGPDALELGAALAPGATVFTPAALSPNGWQDCSWLLPGSALRVYRRAA